MNVRETPNKASAALFISWAALCGCGGGTDANLADDSIPLDARRALEDPQRLELISLRPGHHESPPPNSFRSWEKLGSVEVTDAAERKRLADALLKGADENDDEAMACCEPRNALRVTRDDRTFDFVICFECLQVLFYEGETEVGHFLVSESPQPVFDEMLRAAGIELAPSA